MKKIIVLLLISALLLSACNGENTATDTAANTTKSTTTAVAGDDVTSDETTQEITDTSYQEVYYTPSVDAENFQFDDWICYINLLDSKASRENFRSSCTETWKITRTSYQGIIEEDGPVQTINISSQLQHTMDNGRRNIRIEAKINEDDITYISNGDKIEYTCNGQTESLPNTSKEIDALLEKFQAVINTGGYNSQKKNSDFFGFDNRKSYVLRSTYNYNPGFIEAEDFAYRILPYITTENDILCSLNDRTWSAKDIDAECTYEMIVGDDGIITDCRCISAYRKGKLNFTIEEGTYIFEFESTIKSYWE